MQLQKKGKTKRKCNQAKGQEMRHKDGNKLIKRGLDQISIKVRTNYHQINMTTILLRHHLHNQTQLPQTFRFYEEMSYVKNSKISI